MNRLFSCAPTALAMLFVVGCSPDKVLDSATKGPGGGAPAPAPVVTAAPTMTAAPALSKVEFSENDFTESDRNRDPFRAYASLFTPQKDERPHQSDKDVILPQYSIDELKLVAIVTGGEYPRAMVVDPGGKGWVLKRGSWVGRPEVVHTGGANGADYQLNWRVEKVRDGDVVFTREDPAQPGIPPASRVISLHPESDKNTQIN